jgi:hypothetical protein
MDLVHLTKKLGELGLIWPDAASAHVSLGTPLTPHDRHRWQGLLRHAYGSPALLVGHAIFGRDLELSDLPAIQAGLPGWQRRVQECRSLAPLLGTFVRTGLPAPANYQLLRDGALRKGLTPSAWKWLCRQPPATVRKLLALGWNAEAVFWLNLLSKAYKDRPTPLWLLEAGRPYLFGAHYNLLQGWAEHNVAQEHLNLERFFRLVPMQDYPELRAQFEALSAALMVSMQSPRWAIQVKPGMTWKSLLERVRRMNQLRAQEALAAAQLEAKKREDLRWEPYVGSFTHAGVSAKELVSNAELALEGGVMSHCVGDGAYLQDCATGSQALFSLTEPMTGARATLQLRFNAAIRHWYIAQLAGFGNSAVPRMFWNAARALQARMPL